LTVCRRYELALAVLGMPQLAAAFAHVAVRGKNPVHRARRAQVWNFIEQHGPHLLRCGPQSDPKSES
jgi:hypothetical protein